MGIIRYTGIKEATRNFGDSESAMAEIFIGLVFCIVILVAVIAGGIHVVRVAIRRTAQADGRNIALGVVVAFATALLVFVLVYLSAWSAMRQRVALGGIHSATLWKLHYDFKNIRRLLTDYHDKHGRYPDSLKRLPELNEWQFDDGWKHPYQYSVTEIGYRLISLGRDGLPGGEGLDADIDSEREYPSVEPTLRQFLFEAAGGGTLLRVALVASFLVGLTCYVASGKPAGQPVSMVALLSSIVATTTGAVVVSFFLLSIYLIGEYH